MAHIHTKPANITFLFFTAFALRCTWFQKEISTALHCIFYTVLFAKRKDRPPDYFRKSTNKKNRYQNQYKQTTTSEIRICVGSVK